MANPDPRYEEEPDLDYGADETIDPEFDAAPLYDRGVREPLPGADENPVDWAPIRKKLKAHRLAKGIGEDGKKMARKRVVAEDKDVTVTMLGHEIPVAEFPSSPKSLANRALAKGGWTIKGVLSAAHHAAVLFQDDSKAGAEGSKDKDEHRRGDVRYPAEERQHFVIHGRLDHEGSLAAAFRAVYERRPAGTKSGVAWKFAGADRRDYVLGRSEFTLQAAEFNDWFDIFVKPAEPRAPRKTLEEKRDARAAAPIETGEWHG